MFKKKNSFRKISVCMLAFIIFCQFTNISAFAIPIKEKKNTLSLSGTFSPKPLPEIPQREKSELAQKILKDDLIQPHAVRELNHTLKSIRDIVGKIEEKIGKGEDPGIQIRSANLLAHYRKNIEPVLSRLETILRQDTDVYEKGTLKIESKAGFFGNLLKFKNYFDTNVTVGPEKPKLAPSPPSFRPSNFKPIKPDTSGKVKPAYLLQKSRRKTTDKVLPKKTLQTAPQTLSSESSAITSGAISILSVPPPDPEDLEETIDVVITQEMRDLVASLNNSPARIFEWVKKNIEVEFYYGSLKGSRGAFIEKAGNDIDTVSLLLALYRAANIPCRYVTGTIELPIEKAKNLTGVDDPQKLGSLIASAGIPGILIVSGDEVVAVQMEHTWAEALVDYDPYAGAKAGEGDLWVPLSPWYKPYEYDNGVDLVTMSGFDSESYLDDFISDVKPESPVNLYKLYFEDYLKANNPGMNWQDGLRTREIKPEKFRTLPNTLNLEVVSVNGEYAELPDTLRHKVTLNVPQVSLSYSFNLSEVVGKKVTYSYPAADEASKTLIDSSGGIENVDPLAVNLRPSIKIEGEAVATGDVVNAGYYHTLRTTFSMPGQGSDFVEYSVISGAYYAVGLDPQLVSNKFLVDRIAEYISTIGDTPENTDNMDEITGEAIYLAVMKYFNDCNTGDIILAQSLKDVFLKQTSGAITGKNLVVYTLFGIPSDLEPGGYFVDAKRNIYTPISISGDDSRELDFMILGGYNASYQEHNLFEEFFHLEAISTVKLLSLANEQGMPVYDIDQSNIDDIWHSLDLPTDVESAIWSAVKNQNHIVRVHEDTLIVKNWTGAGYVDRDPTTNAAGYIISGGWAGGSTIDDIKKWLGDKWGKFKDWFFGGDPVNIANGNLFLTDKDLSVPAVGLPITIKRYYNSFSDYNGPFGYGWSYTYDERITENSADESLTYKAGDGGNFVYTKNPDGSYQRPLGMHSTLSKDASGFELIEKNGTKHIFDTSGKLTSIMDRNGNTITFTYTGDNLTAITDPAGREFSLSYNADNKIESVTAPGDDTWTYSYDGDDLASITKNADQTISYTYYPDHKMASRTNAEGGAVTYDYYSDGKTHMNLLPNGGTFLFSYNSPLSITTITDPDGNSVVHYYNDQGVTTGLLDPLGYEELYEYDKDLNRIKIIDKNGGIIKNIYDSNGNLLSTTNQLNYTPTYTYEPNFNQVETFIDPMGNTTSNTYDAVNGNLLTTTNPEGVVTEYDYYPNGTTKNINRSGVIKSEFSYFSDGNVETIKDAYGNTTSITYNELGKLKSKTDANGHTTQHTLDNAGNILTTIDAENIETKFTYNKFNMRTGLSDGRDNTTIYEYNNWGKLTKVSDPMGYEKTYTYNLGYDIATETDKNGNTITYEYDGLNRISKKIYSDGYEESYLYDANGNIIQISDKNGTITKEYDKLNKLIKVVDIFGQEIQYSYYPNGNRKTMTDPQGGITSYEYYSDGQLKSITDPAFKKTDFYYQNGLLDKVVYPNGTETNYSYDLNDRTTQLVNKKTDGAIISIFEYLYDPVGNKAQMTDDEGVHTYQYDMTNQVTRVDYPDGTYNEYTYDAAYNRSTLTTLEGTIDYTYDKNNRMLAAGIKSYTYDNNGNQLTETANGVTTAYQYDLKNQLAQINYGDGSSNEFTYNVSGQRITKTDSKGEVHFIYDGHNILMETNAEGVINSSYINGTFNIGALYLKNMVDKYTYFIKDALGSITQFTDSAGDVVESYSYDIFGSIRIKTSIDDLGIKQKFVGKELDEDSKLMYFGARYYDAEIGRFITADTYTCGPDDERGRDRGFLLRNFFSYIGALNPLKLNLNIYAANNPVSYIDLDGHEPVTVFILGVTVLIALLITAIADWRGEIDSPYDALKTFAWNLIPGFFGAIGLFLIIAATVTTIPVWVSLLIWPSFFFTAIIEPPAEYFDKV